MRAWLTRTLSFFLKEIHEIRRQPKLILSLIAGPFFVLALFGATFESSKPSFRTVLVWPAEGVPGVQQGPIEYLIQRNFNLIAVVPDRDEAMQMLEEGDVDVVQIIPSDLIEKVERGERPEIEVVSHAVDPTAESWIQSLMFNQVNILNRLLLLERTGQAQEQAVTIKVEMRDAQNTLSELEVNLTPERKEQAESSIQTLQNALTLLIALLPPVPEEEGDLSARVDRLRSETMLIMSDLIRLQEMIESGTIEAETERLNSINERLSGLESTIDIFINLPPEAIVAPIQPSYLNVRGQPFSLVVYYAPGVLALLIQHLAITLGAMALVREKLMGSFEMFRIAPIKIPHVIIGKTFAYSVYVFVASAALAFLLRLLNVPFASNILSFFLLIFLLTLASLGIGFLISAVSGSDSQAIQLTMLVLLLSIFFSGFFLPLSGFRELARPVTLILPLTHGLRGMQELMLIGRTPDTSVCIGLILIAIGSYGLVLFLVQRSFKKVIS